MNTEEVNAELKLLELVLSSEYNVLSGVHQSNRVYYFITTTTRSCYEVGVFYPKWKQDVLDYEFNNVHLSRVEDIRCSKGYGYFIRLPHFTDVLPTLVACGYKPTTKDLFNITTEEDGDSEVEYIREQVKVASRCSEDDSDELDAIDSSAGRTQEYIDSLELIRDEWETAADKLHSLIADYLSQEESTKEDLQYDLDQITFHHLLKKENISDK